MSENALPLLLGGFLLEAHLDVPTGGGEGVICALGDWNNGWRATSSTGGPCGVQHPRGPGTGHRATGWLAGRAVVSVRYRRGTSPGGEVTLAVDDTVVAAETLTEDLPFMWQIGGAGLLVGRDRGLPVSDDYDTPFACTAGIRWSSSRHRLLRQRAADVELAAVFEHE